MNYLVYLVLLAYFALPTESVDPSYLRSAPKSEDNSTSDYPKHCDNPPSTNIDPEKCCKFPKLFDESISQKCENEFGSVNNSAMINDMVTDSCVIECMFNRSGLNKDSKLHREDVIKMMNVKTKNDTAWSQIATKAVDACFNELTSDDLDEIAEHIKNEIGKNLKPAVNRICHPVSSIMLDCIYRELYKVCPKEKFATDISECGLLQNYTKTCDDW